MSRRITAALSVAAVTLVVATGGASGGSQAPGQQAPRNQTPPSIGGRAVVPNALTSSTGTWQGKGLKFAYQWLRCDSAGTSCTSINGATASAETLSNGDVGTTLRVIVTASNRNGSTAATSAQTAVVTAAASPPPPPGSVSSPAVPPSDNSLPVVGGTAQQNQTLSTSTGSWSGTTPMTYSYQWQRCNVSGGSCAPITGATAASYVLAAADVGSTLRASVTASNSVGSATATSTATSVVSASSASPQFAGDFESGACPPWDHCDNGGGGILQRVTSPVAQGSYALQATVTSTAHASNSSGSDAVWIYNDIKAYDGHQGQTNWTHIMVRFPSVAYKPTAGNWNWFIEHHNNGGYTNFSCSQEKAEISWDIVTDSSGQNPHLMERTMGGATCSPTTKWFDFGPLQYDHWYDIYYQVRWDAANTGFVNFYIDGRLAASYSGPTLYLRPDGTTDTTNFDLVNYRGHASWDSTIYFDNAKVGPSQDSVR